MRSTSRIRGYSRFAQTAAACAVSVLVLTTLTGCSIFDDDDDDGTPGGSPMAQTTFTGASGADTVIVTVDEVLPSTDGGILASHGGNAHGLLLVGSDERIEMAGEFDPDTGEVTVEDGSGSYSFTGTATSSSLSGDLTTPAGTSMVAMTPTTSDAPLEGLLGTWGFTDSFNEVCPEGTFQGACVGQFRVRLAGGKTVLDLYDTCDGGESFECTLEEINLDGGEWSGDTFTLQEPDVQTDGPCTETCDESLTLTVSENQMSFDFGSTCTYSGAECPVAGMTCTETGSGSATRCTDCWPVECGEVR